MGSWKYVAAAAAVVATPLAAQDAPQQTVEGAQEFLRRITNQYSMANAIVTPGAASFVYGNIRFQPESACVSNIESELTWTLNNERSTPGLSNDENFERYKAVQTRDWTDANSVANWHKQMEQARFPRQVNWQSVSSVETIAASDNVKRVVIVRFQPAFAIYAPDAALATRIAYAMEFLRAACDVSAETGF